MGTLSNSEDADEIPHNAVFFHGLHFLLFMAETIFRERNIILLGKCSCDNVHHKFIISVH